MNESEAERGDPESAREATTKRDVPPWMVVNERIPWPRFTQEEWDRLLELRDRVRAGRVTEGASATARPNDTSGPARRAPGPPVAIAGAAAEQPRRPTQRRGSSKGRPGRQR